MLIYIFPHENGVGTTTVEMESGLFIAIKNERLLIPSPDLKNVVHFRVERKQSNTGIPSSLTSVSWL